MSFCLPSSCLPPTPPSFVAGSDGNLYEGRGWHWQGAHTKGHNALGYGVAFIGDYMFHLPVNSSLALVRDRLATCAVASSALVGNYTIKGHRQVVSTDCPGDALYHEITGWDHFGVSRDLSTSIRSYSTVL